jgi:hypothetical protein
MPGYVIVERSALNLSRESGIIVHAEEIGFLDFLRELAGEDVPFPKFTELHLVGLEEVLFVARPNDAEPACDLLGTEKAPHGAAGAPADGTGGPARALGTCRRHTARNSTPCLR